MIQGAIFDMDGLMFDTERLSSYAWLRAAEILNYPITEHTLSKIRGTNEATIRRILKEDFGDLVDFDQIHKMEREIMDQKIEEEGVPLKTGLFELLDYLREHKVQLAVATSTRRCRAEKYLKMAGVYEYFDFLVFGDEVKNGKPEPDIFLHAARRLSLQPEDCVVFEDSPNGIKAAYAAKTKVIGVQDLSKFDKNICNMLDSNCKTLEDAIPCIKQL